MKQFQINKRDLSQTRLVDLAEDDASPGEGEIVVSIERFGFSANNITYAVAGDTLNYWQFFPAKNASTDVDWGVVPVWGFAQITKSNHGSLEVGERVFGYFPPASTLVMKPVGLSNQSFFDGSEHRSSLPKGYNSYRRVGAAPSKNTQADNLQMLLFPLYATSFCLADLLRSESWFDAQQIIVASASSKTSIGLAYGLASCDDRPAVVGLTSKGNESFTKELGLYDQVATYNDMVEQIKTVPSAIVDMSGNADMLGKLHAHLGDAIMKTINVGLTHWETPRHNPDIIKERSSFFFAPTYMQNKMKEWGVDEFNKRSGQFVKQSSVSSANWLKMETHTSLDALPDLYQAMLEGSAAPDRGIVFEL